MRPVILPAGRYGESNKASGAILPGEPGPMTAMPGCSASWPTDWWRRWRARWPGPGVSWRSAAAPVIFTGLLRQANGAARLVALDLDAALVAAARRRLGPEAGVSWLVADGEAPIRGEYDLIIANATFQWFTRPEATLAAYYRNLAPGGVLAFSTLGPQTFPELAAALEQAARSLNLPATPPIPAQGFGDRETWSHRISQAGFSQLRLARELVTATFPSVRAVSQDPPGHGGHQSPTRPLFPPPAARPHRGLRGRLRPRRRHPGKLRNDLGGGAETLRRFWGKVLVLVQGIRYIKPPSFSLPLEGGGSGWGWQLYLLLLLVITLPPTPSPQGRGSFEAENLCKVILRRYTRGRLRKSPYPSPQPHCVPMKNGRKLDSSRLHARRSASSMASRSSGKWPATSR